jgi:hypothetical protein
MAGAIRSSTGRSSEGGGVEVLSRALPGLHSLFAEVREVHNAARSGDTEAVEFRLPAMLSRMFRAVATALDAANLSETRATFIADWGETTKNGVGNWEPHEYRDGSFSPAFAFLYSSLVELGAVAGGAIPPIDAYNLTRFEDLLRRTSVLLRRRRVSPTSEADVQKVMDDYLHAAFSDYTPQVHVHGTIKNFKPDGGVLSLKAAVEFKFARTEREVTTALSGILEDSAGYRGSTDWTRFYSVVYMTGPFEAEDRFAADLRRAEAFSWTPILVNGSEPPTPKRRSRRRSRQRASSR